MLVVLDTDHLSVLQWQEQPACDRLLARLDEVPPDEIATTIVSFHEQVQGWLAFLGRTRSSVQVVRAYDKLESMLRSFLKMNVHPFDVGAELRFANLRPICRRLQTMDLRIAAVAMNHGAILLSRNLRDFRQVPGLSVEDWTR